MMLMAVAICAARGNAFSDWSELSMRNNCMPPTLSIGKMATAMTMIPMPPTHCSSARHIRMPGGALSRPTMTVEPVVVRPDMASNTASVKLSCRSEKANGKAAKNVSATQVTVVMTKA